jgi:hypothetical protein
MCAQHSSGIIQRLNMWPLSSRRLHRRSRGVVDDEAARHQKIAGELQRTRQQDRPGLCHSTAIDQ